MHSLEYVDLGERVKYTDLEYPTVGENPNVLDIDLVDVRASDGIRVCYDFDRDGWAIYQPVWTNNDGISRTIGWRQVAFLKSWEFDFSDTEKGKK